MLKQQPGYHPQYKGLVKENIIRNFTRQNGILPTSKLSDLTDKEYEQLIREMQQDALLNQQKKEWLNESIRREYISKIFHKLSELDVTTAKGYEQVNFHIKRLKGFGERIIPEFTTEELPSVFKAVCNYVDYYKEIIEQQRKLACLN